MNHDIAHCVGKAEPKCGSCLRLKAHREIRNLVHQGKLTPGKVINYINADDCVAGNFIHFKEGGER